MPEPLTVAIVAYDGVSLLDLSAPLEALRVASTHASNTGGGLLYDCPVVSLRGGPVMTSDGVSLVTAPLSSLDGRAIDTLLVPGALAIETMTADEGLVTWVRERSADCRRVVSVCTGAFLLGAAGLLDGRRAVTHWMFCGALADRHPETTVESDAIFVREGKVWSSAGVTTGIDMALALIEQDFGRPVAMHVARVLVVYLRRAGGQSQYSALLEAQTEAADDPFGELERWISENLTKDLRVERLAERVGMSARNFARRYVEQRNRTPARAVEAIRIDAARRALEETADRIDVIARRCGFSDEEQMRNTFVRHLGIPPRTYRQRFAS